MAGTIDREPNQVPDLEASAGFRNIEVQLRRSEEIVSALQARGDLPLGALLTQTLERIISQSGLDGMMIASEDGLPVAQSDSVGDGEILAAIGCLFDSTVTRAESDGIIPQVEEMMLRGSAGEHVIVRCFPDMGRQFLLVAYSRKPCAHRRATARAVKQCGDLLALAMKGPGTKRGRRTAKQDTAMPSQEERTNHGESNEA